MKIDLAEIRRIQSRSNDLTQNFEQQFAEMATTLGQICENVQSSELSEANKNFVETINDIATRIKSNLPSVTTFLGDQVTKYEQTNEVVQSDLDNLANNISTNLQ